MNLLLPGLLLAVASAVVCHGIAKHRGADPVFWGVMGALFGPLAIPFALFARPKSNRNSKFPK